MTTEAPPPASQPPAPPSRLVRASPAGTARPRRGPPIRLGFRVRFLAIILDGIVIGVISGALAVFALGGAMPVGTTEAGA